MIISIIFSLKLVKLFNNIFVGILCQKSIVNFVGTSQSIEILGHLTGCILNMIYRLNDCMPINGFICIYPFLKWICKCWWWINSFVCENTTKCLWKWNHENTTNNLRSVIFNIQQMDFISQQNFCYNKNLRNQWYVRILSFSYQ